jgi:hypothetical protein
MEGDRPGQTRLLRNHRFIYRRQHNIDAVKAGSRHYTDKTARFHMSSF